MVRMDEAGTTMSADGASRAGTSDDRASGLSQRRFRALLANVADMVTISNRDGRIIYASPATEKVSGYTPEEFMARNPFDAIHPEDLPRCEEAMTRLASTPDLSLDLEHRVRRKDGRWVWVEGTFTSLFDDPDVGGLLATVRDITERKQAEEALRASEARHAYLLELSDALRPLADPVVIQGEACRLLAERLDVNRAYYVEVDETAGVARIGRDFVRNGSLSLVGEHRVAVFSWSAEILRRGECYVIADTQTSPLVPPADRPALAALQIVACIGAPLIKAGRLVGALCVADSRTREWSESEVDLLREVGVRIWAAVEAARAEEAFRDSRVELERQIRKFDVTLSTITDYVFSFGRDGRFLYANRALLDLWGLAAGEEVGKDLSELNYPPDLRQQVLDYLRHIFETGETIRDEALYTAPGGVAAHYEYFMSPVFAYDGTVEYVVGSSRDVTERKQAEEQSRRAAAINAYRVVLNDALRPLGDPNEIRAEAMRVLGEHLRVDRVLYAEIDAGNETVVVADNYVNGVPKLVGRLPLSDFEQSGEKLRAEQRLVISDVVTDEDLAEVDRTSLTEWGVVSTIGIPLVKEGRWVANLGVHHGTARAWTEDEIAVVEETAERTWGAVEHASAEEALRESEERLQRVIAIDTVGVLFFDLDGRITDANEAFSRMIGYSRDELLESVSWELITPPEFMAAYHRAAEELAAGVETAPYEKQFVRKDGSRLWSLCAPRRLSGSGRGSRCVEFVLDITERKRFEAESARLRSREAAMRAETAERERISRELHDRVAHSMGVVYQSLQLHKALAENDLERAQQKLAIAEETARTALDQTRNLAIELRRSVSEETEDGVASALRTLIETSALDGVDARLSFSGDESLLPRDVGAQVYLIMREAIRNALKHSGCEKLQASLEVLPGELLGAVTDDGDGFDPDAISDDGRGIGLGSMRERAEMMGGELDLTSKPGEGTTIEIRVPLNDR